MGMPRVGILASLLLLIVPVSALAVEISGHVTVDGGPSANEDVQIRSSSGQITHVQTDAQGYFHFYQFPSPTGSWCVTVRTEVRCNSLSGFSIWDVGTFAYASGTCRPPCEFDSQAGERPQDGSGGASRIAASVRVASANPFRDRVELRLSAASGASAPVVVVYDAAGRTVRTLSAVGRAGVERSVFWTGDRNDGTPAGAGVYFARGVGTHGSTRATLVKIR